MAPTEQNNLGFNVSGLLKDRVGAMREHELDEPVLVLDEETRATNLYGNARLLRINSGVLAEGQIAADVTLECSRCLILLSSRLRVEFTEEYRPLVDVQTGTPLEVLQEGETDDDFSRLTPNHILDLSEPVRQSILVDLPYNPLCRQDCAGLCPQCGVDLNAEDCGHRHERTDNRLAALAALLDRDDQPN